MKTWNTHYDQDFINLQFVTLAAERICAQNFSKTSVSPPRDQLGRSIRAFESSLGVLCSQGWEQSKLARVGGLENRAHLEAATTLTAWWEGRISISRSSYTSGLEHPRKSVPVAWDSFPPLKTSLCMAPGAKAHQCRQGSQDMVNGIQGDLGGAPTVPGSVTLILLLTWQI